MMAIDLGDGRAAVDFARAALADHPGKQDP